MVEHPRLCQIHQCCNGVADRALIVVLNVVVIIITPCFLESFLKDAHYRLLRMEI